MFNDFFACQQIHVVVVLLVCTYSISGPPYSIIHQKRYGSYPSESKVNKRSFFNHTIPLQMNWTVYFSFALLPLTRKGWVPATLLFEPNFPTVIIYTICKLMDYPHRNILLALYSRSLCTISSGWKSGHQYSTLKFGTFAGLIRSARLCAYLR